MYIRKNDKPVLENFQFGRTIERYSVGGKKVPTWALVLVVVVLVILAILLFRVVFSKNGSSRSQNFGFRFY